MGDEDTGRSANRPMSVTNDDSLTPTQRFARAVQRRDALIQERERRDSAAGVHEKRCRVINRVPAE
jgi:hypothetical protein